jgi:hypothetical protein
MRARLPHPRTAARQAGRRKSHRATPAAKGPTASSLERARGAGGPVDRACYSCGCGYVFVAQVSTTVTCPHCHADQAW